MKYEPGDIEPKWQKRWFEERIYGTGSRHDKEAILFRRESGRRTVSERAFCASEVGAEGTPFYNLMMFPYPSCRGSTWGICMRSRVRIFMVG